MVSEVSGIPVRKIRKVSKQRTIVVARQVTIALTAAYNDVSMSWVCHMLKYADHTSAIYAKRCVQASLEAGRKPNERRDPQSGPQIRQLYRECERRINKIIETRGLE